jgi:hypothetical protein
MSIASIISITLTALTPHDADDADGDGAAVLMPQGPIEGGDADEETFSGSGSRLAQPRLVTPFSCRPLCFIWIPPNEKERPARKIENDVTAPG